jgi:predicted dehydrogenase
MNTQSSRKIGVGIIGVGNWGRYGHIPVLRLLPNYEIVAVASRREEYGKQLAKEYGSTLDASVLDLAHLYAAFAKGGDKGAYDAPTFADAVRMHRLIDLISNAASAGDRQTVTHW